MTGTLEKLKGLTDILIKNVRKVLAENENKYPEDFIIYIFRSEASIEEDLLEVHKDLLIYLLKSFKKDFETDLLNYSEEVKAINEVLALIK